MSKKPGKVGRMSDYERIPPERRGDACLTSIPVRIVVATVLVALIVKKARR